MARSFLFPQDTGDAATTRLIATAAQLTGFMKGEPGGPREGWYQPGADNSAMLGQLHQALASTYPQAGPAFHAVRLWTNLLWQPAYLAVIAAHLHGAMPDLFGISQQRRGIYVDGYRLKPGAQAPGSTEALIELGGGQLKAMAGVMLEEVNGFAKLRPLPARRLLADRMLSLMVWLSQRRHDLPVDTIEAWSEQWLEAAGLSGQGRLEPIDTANGRRLLIVRRKGCCLDYLIDPDRYCASCPKQDEAVRVARQTANAMAELG
ncbi:MAG: siderophore ferric iron reductase [Alphaproteobacteria bacterium]|nr:siderophore ferric iron reductase [Alphaproteobacteria bacterium]MBU1562221.1 siderophore ferric iron reductase [Alphaproteobacteria bacterium]MBU2302807.1 siderophore ferric iron reductase [Alphaproteobacteria bacterium]MBU2366448.1 siderophore ferric iron reductase [Alphaproteobacteria bacterium]